MYSEKFKKMVKQERKEHPSLRLKTVERIVKDHLRISRRRR